MAYTDIDKPSDYFNTVLYTGNGGTQSITSLEFAPNWVWIKSRSTVRNNVLNDTVRGATKNLFSNTTGAEATDTGTLTSFNSDGFTLSNNAKVNESSTTYASWNWKAGTSFTNDASATGIGSIDSAGSVNTDAGFSIVSWTGSGSSATLAHGLGATPKMIIVKNRSDAVNWFVYNHSVITAGGSNKSFMTLNTTDALGTNGSATTFTSVSSTTFGVGTDNIINGSSDNMIAYCFAEKQGYSKFGSYVGNGNADGTFVYLGFKPAWVMAKATTDSGQSWLISDVKRNPFNVADDRLFANLSNAENQPSDSGGIDFVSNGFKIRTNDGSTNASGQTRIYMAFAENPFVTSTGVPATAR